MICLTLLILFMASLIYGLDVVRIIFSYWNFEVICSEIYVKALRELYIKNFRGKIEKHNRSVSSEQDSVSIGCDENVAKNLFCIEKNGSATFIQNDSNNNKTGIKVPDAVVKEISKSLEDEDIVQDGKKDSKDICSQKNKKRTKKEQDRVSYSRQKERELLQQQLLAKVKEDEERERKRREKEAERRRKVEEEKKESLLQQAVLSLKDTKQKGNSKKVDHVSKPPKQNSQKTDFTTNSEVVASCDGVLDLWDETDVPMKENVSKSDVWDEDVWQEDSGTKKESTWQSHDIPNRNGTGDNISTRRNYSTRGSSRPSRNSSRKDNRNNNNNKSQMDTRRGNSVNQRWPEGGGRSRQNSYSRSISESRPQNAWDSSIEQKEQLQDFVPAPQPEVNVWHERQVKSENIQEIQPLNTTDEDVMLMRAIEQSRVQYLEDEKKRKKWEEECQLQLEYVMSKSALGEDQIPMKDANVDEGSSSGACWQPLCGSHLIDHGLPVASDSASSHSQRRHSEVRYGGARPKTSSNQWSDVWDVSYDSRKDKYPPIGQEFGKSAPNDSGSLRVTPYTKSHYSSNINNTSYEDPWGDSYSVKQCTGDSFQKSGFSSDESAPKDTEQTKDNDTLLDDPAGFENSTCDGWGSVNSITADRSSPHNFNTPQDETANEEEPSVSDLSTEIVCGVNGKKDSCWETSSTPESVVRTKSSEHDEIQKFNCINAVAHSSDKSPPGEENPLLQDFVHNSTLLGLISGSTVEGVIPQSLRSDENFSSSYVDKEQQKINGSVVGTSFAPCDISLESCVLEGGTYPVQKPESTLNTQTTLNSGSSESYTLKLNSASNLIVESDITTEKFSYQNSSTENKSATQNINNISNERGQLSLSEDVHNHTLFGKEPSVSTMNSGSSKVVGGSVGQKVYNNNNAENTTGVTTNLTTSFGTNGVLTGTPSVPSANNMPTGYPFPAPVGPLDPSLWLAGGLPLNTPPFMWGPMMMPFSNTFFLQQLRALQMYYIAMGIPQQPIFMPPPPVPVYPQNATTQMPNPSNSFQSGLAFNPNAPASQDISTHEYAGSVDNIKNLPPGMHRSTSGTVITSGGSAAVSTPQREARNPSEAVPGSPSIMNSYQANSNKSLSVVPDTQRDSLDKGLGEVKNMLSEMCVSQTSARSVSAASPHDVSYILPPTLPEKSFPPKVVNGDNHEPCKQLEIPVSQDVPHMASEDETEGNSSYLGFLGTSGLTPDDESCAPPAIPPPRLTHRNKHGVLETIRQPKCSLNQVFDLMCGKSQGAINPPSVRKSRSASVPSDTALVLDVQLPQSTASSVIEFQDCTRRSSGGSMLAENPEIPSHSFHYDEPKNSDWSIPVKNSEESTTEGWGDEDAGKMFGSGPSTTCSGWSDSEHESSGTYNNYNTNKGSDIWDDEVEILKPNKASLPNKNFSSERQFNRGPQKYPSGNAPSQGNSRNYSSQTCRGQASSYTSNDNSSRGVSSERRNFSTMGNGDENASNNRHLSGVQKIFHRSDRRNR